MFILQDLVLLIWPLHSHHIRPNQLFVSCFWQELFKKLKVYLRMWTAFHPEMDSSSEHSNKTTMEALYHYINTHQNDWSNYLVHVEMAMNNLINATMDKLPMELLYRTYIRLIFHQVDTFNAILYRQQLPDKINESI